MPNFDVIYTKKDHLRNLEKIMPDGYLLNRKDGFFYKKEDNRLIELFIYSSNYFPHSARYTGGGGSITFYEVERIFNEILRHHPVSGKTYKEYWDTCGVSFGKNYFGETDYFFLLDKDVETDADFEEVRPHLEQVIVETINWIDSYPTLKDLYDHFKNIPDSDKGKNLSRPWPNKWPIILKLCNDPSYIQFIDEEIDFYTNDSPDAQEVNYYNALKTHLEQL